MNWQGASRMVEWIITNVCAPMVVVIGFGYRASKHDAGRAITSGHAGRWSNRHTAMHDAGAMTATTPLHIAAFAAPNCMEKPNG